MRWITDIINVKVLILLLILLVFLIIAVVILAMEYRIKRRHRRKILQEVENTRLKELSKDLRSAKSIESKLSVIDKHAKSLFRERHHVATNKSYAELEKVFEGKQAYEYASFCKKMFEAYYADEPLHEQKVKGMLRELTRLIRETEIYLNADKYNPEKLLKQQGGEKEHPQEHVKRKQVHAKKSTQLITKKEKELRKKDEEEKKRLHELEERIKMQQQKIKEQEKLQKQLEKRLTQTNKSKSKDEGKKKLLHGKKKQAVADIDIEKDDSPPPWRSTIDAGQIAGKDWVRKKQKRKRRSR